MRSFLPHFDLRAPANLTDALETLAQRAGAWRPFAGGTDLMVLLEAGKLPAGRYLSLWGLPELRGIEITDDEIVLGALTTYADVLRSEALQAECPLVCRAAAETGGVATQNRGTIGGNIANASPAADTPPALLVYDADVDLVSVRGVRRVPYDRFHSATSRWIWRPTRSSSRSGWRAAAAAGCRLAEGRHAPRAGDLEGVLRGGDRSDRHRRARHPHRARQRRPDRRARGARRGRDPRARDDSRDDRRRLRRARARHRADRRSALDRASIGCASRAICWRSSCRQRSRDSGPRYRGSSPCSTQRMAFACRPGGLLVTMFPRRGSWV